MTEQKVYKLGKKTFELPTVYPNLEECRLVFFKVIQRAIRDYINFYGLHKTASKHVADSAKTFLFSDSYKISWGNMRLSLEDITDILDIDLCWLRENILRKEKLAQENCLTGVEDDD